MQKSLAISMAVAGGLLIIVAVHYLNIGEVRQWFPVALLVGGILAWKGVTKYRDA